MGGIHDRASRGCRRTRRALVRAMGGALLALLAGATPLARAALPGCAALAAAGQVTGDPAASWASAIGGAVAEAERWLTGEDERPHLRVVDLGPVTGAWYCPGGDAIYVSRALATWAYLGRAVDGEDFVAFVVGHELAHRHAQSAASGDAAWTLVGAGRADLAGEVAADARAAVLAAVARDPSSGRCFSPWAMARRRTIEHYLVDEVGAAVGGAEWSRRRAALLGALDRLDALGGSAALCGARLRASRR